MEYEEDEVYLYLDFKGRLPAETFNTEIFFNITNLNTKHPVVQLGQSVFYGTYEDCVGTNLFFEENEEATDIDESLKQTPIKLKYVTKQFKILNMQWAKLPEDVTEEITDDYDIQFKENYDAVLKKIENGALRIEDLELRKRDKVTERKEVVKSTQPVTARAKQEEKSTKQESTNLVLEKYTKMDSLMQLARQPLKRKVCEETLEIPTHLKRNYIYNKFKNKMLQNNAYFDPLVVTYNKSTLEGAVDINNCIRQGLIDLNDDQLDINSQTKNSLLTLQNIENLSLPMRYCVVRSQMKKLKRQIKNATETEIQQITELGVNMMDSYKILKMLACDIKKHISIIQTFSNEAKENGEDEEKSEGGSDKDGENSVESLSQ